MTLSAAFASHLVDPSSTEGLADELSSAALDRDAELLRRFAVDGVHTIDGEFASRQWAGHPCHLGVTPPDDAMGGDIWFDVVEVVAMMLIPRPPAVVASWPAAVRERMTANVSWLSVAPVAGWQVAGWASASGTDVEGVGSVGTRPATGLSGWTASRYATFFGKASADRFDWAAVHEMPAAVAASLWHVEAGPELVGYIGEGRVLVLDREQSIIAGNDSADDADDAGELDQEFVDDAEPLVGVRFRTHVSSQVGLIETGVRDAHLRQGRARP